jgi:glutathione S-transferase
VFLQKLENQLNQHQYLFGDAPSLADYAIFPFIRQFAAVDSTWFEAATYPKLRTWLNEWINSTLFKSIMTKPLIFTD